MTKILAAPTNFYSVTALFKRFMERLAVYAYWPWAMNGRQLRKASAPQKKAVRISSSAAPGIIGRWLYGSEKWVPALPGRIKIGHPQGAPLPPLGRLSAHSNR